MSESRVVTRYMGSGIKGLKMGGIRDHSPGIWDHNPHDRDQRCFPLDQGLRFKVQGSFISHYLHKVNIERKV